MPTLKKGDKGPLVVLLQSMLSANGFPSLMINGFYDDYTQVCVSSLQTKWRIPVTGNAREATWRVLLDDTVTSNTPLYNCIMIRSGLLLVLTLDKPSYKLSNSIKMSLVKMNLSGKSIILNYNNGQRYDFSIAYSRGRVLWRWSDDKSFTQATGRVVIPPGQSIKYTEAFRLPKEFKHQEFTLYARNTAKQTSHIRLEVKIRTSP
ncbi:MAG TPA: BsuPI-related putative proteinase inhibitor [Bacillota bacterium]|nr:BsuPI-related putative proteinase inhibitor [Bacillota bacterium]